MSTPLTDLEHLELAKAIAAYKRGEGPCPPTDLLRRAVDSIRVRRMDFAAQEKEKSPRGKKAAVQNVSFADLGF